MRTPETVLGSRIATLEHQLRVLRLGFTAAICCALIAALSSVVIRAQDAKSLRVRRLVVEDSMGRDRIVFGRRWARRPGRDAIYGSGVAIG